jgi:hypothetical protein
MADFEWKEDVLVDAYSEADPDIRFVAYYGYNAAESNPTKRLFIAVDRKNAFDELRHNGKVRVPANPEVVAELGRFVQAFSEKMESLANTTVDISGKPGGKK